MFLLNPQKETYKQFSPKTRELLLKTIDWFESRGKKRLKEADHEREWYSDFLEFEKKEKLFSTFLTPEGMLDEDTCWDTQRICALNEILGFYGLAYWYTWQVTILGLGPIWMSQNKLLKEKTAKLLQGGSIFAFGLSEQNHGADIYSTSMELTPCEDGTYLASGEKYYIGNANEASLVSIFAKKSDSDEYVFFVVDSQHPKFDCIKNVVNSQNYVAHFKLDNYPITEDDILSLGPNAWDCALNTVNVGKFNLGWATIGICTHAFYEAIAHASNRNLFGHVVTDFTHIRNFFVDAYTRLFAMKTFSIRAIDYLKVATKDDRRYLLYNPMVKMKVTTQGEEVIDLIWDVIAAKGFEKDMYFEMASRDIRALPKLEGTVHVNMALVVKFMANYFFKHKHYNKVEKQKDLSNDNFLFDQGTTKGLSKIKFHDYKIAYDSVSSPNVKILKKQIKLLKLLLIIGRPNKKQIGDFDFLHILGELFSIVVYGQLIIEKFEMDNMDKQLLDQIFVFLVKDFSKHALRLSQKPSSSFVQQKMCKQMIKRPDFKQEDFDHVWNKYVNSQEIKYEMNE